MFLAMIKNAIWQNKTQKILAFLTYFLVAALLCVMLNITLNIGNQISKELRSYGANIIVLPKGSSISVEAGGAIYEPLKDKAYLDEANLARIKEIFWRNNITAFAPFLEGKIMMNNKEVFILGTYFDKKIEIKDEEDFHTGIKELYPFLSIEGAWAKDESLDEVMISEEFAKNQALNINDELNLNGRKVVIVGIIKHFDKNENKIIAPLALAQELLDKKGQFSRAEVSALSIPENDLAQKARKDLHSLDSLEFDLWYCTAYISSIAYQIEEDFQGSSTKIMSAVSDAEGFVVKKIQILMLVSALICFLLSSIAIASLINSELQRRKKEIGLLKLLGANNFQIYLLFMSENALIAFIATIFGFIFGIILCEFIVWYIFAYFISINFITLALCISFALIIVVFACVLAFKNINQIEAIKVLYAK